ncbi:sensor histidine kinase [Niallia taxi]|uniref:sensor histidine kinase n=1 Tax=Niallia taxi TaxID=2499688 RepID=UPI0020418E3B|nr:sensor histidine kinase [Niallia taxi]MCM3217395.1 sensor histidine kinase [Niallia taxi]MDK8641410.1 sensor histidine kinase [Niallia taxi]MED4039452.1 sensor histidine kinase [Niallia taxi]
MSIIQRQILWGMSIALILLLFTSGAFLLVFPPDSWNDIWEKQVLDIPFVLFLVSADVAIGLFFGVMSGYSWRKQFNALDGIIHSGDKNKELERESSGFYEEIHSLGAKITNVQNKLKEQIRLSQKLVTEQAEDQHSRVQAVIADERNRLARELHDSVSQQLFAASMLLSAINERRQPEGDPIESKQLKLVEETIHQSQLEMRALLLHLRPAALKDKTLKEGIMELLSELVHKVEMKITWKLEEFSIDKGIEDHLFRILQESVSNTLRHAKASNFDVQLLHREQYVILRVMDDGIGFDVEESKTGSYGLQNMQERAAEIGGQLKIVSLQQKGTRLEVKVPMILDMEAKA